MSYINKSGWLIHTDECVLSESKQELYNLQTYFLIHPIEADFFISGLNGIPDKDMANLINNFKIALKLDTLSEEQLKPIFDSTRLKLFLFLKEKSLI